MNILKSKLEKLLNNEKNKNIRVFSGFDGFVDKIVKVIKSNGNELETNEFFSSIEEFSSYLGTKSGKSCSLGMSVTSKKIGGNMPNFANALGFLGISVDCVGAMGFPVVEQIFENMNENCKLYSISEPGTCDALEFLDGKIMLGINDEIDEIDFKIISERVGNDNLIKMIEESQSLSFLNWSEMPHSNNIWKGFIDEIFPQCKFGERKKLLVDISDCSGKSKKEILGMIENLRQMNEFLDVVLSLNKNEIEQLSQKTDIANGNDDILEIGKKVIDLLGVKWIVLHLTDEAILIGKDEVVSCKKELVKNPKVLTGGGDNFNAGLMFGILNEDVIGLTNAEILNIGNMVSSIYVETGISPSLENLIKYISL